MTPNALTDGQRQMPDMSALGRKGANAASPVVAELVLVMTGTHGLQV